MIRKEKDRERGGVSKKGTRRERERVPGVFPT